MVKRNQNHYVNRKIITNRFIYNLTFKEYAGDINKIIDPNLSKSYIKNNIKDHIILKKRTGKKSVRKEEEIIGTKSSRESLVEEKAANITEKSIPESREESMDIGKVTEKMMESN